jgi:hypothetical protein
MHDPEMRTGFRFAKPASTGGAGRKKIMPASKMLGEKSIQLKPIML